MPGVHVRDIGRYRVYDEIASGGMATVSFGRLLGPVGFARTVAIKELHAQFSKDPEFVAMFLDEARLAARIHHPNVVATLDVVAQQGQLVLVMDYVHGESLARLMRASTSLIAHTVTAGIIAGALHGLHAAHEARSERGEPLGIVHRDISPQNILVGVDGVPRVLDFGVAKAANRLQTTQEGHLKGKIRYMSPEQVSGQDVDRQTDVYAMAIVLHEMTTGRSLFPRGEPGAVVNEILQGRIPHPKEIAPGTPDALDAIIMRGLARDKNARFTDAREMALALEEQVGLATPTQIARWVQSLVQDTLSSRAAKVSAIESSSAGQVVPPIPVEAAPPPPPSQQAPHSQPYAHQPDLLPSGKTAFAVPSAPASSAPLAIAMGAFAVLALFGLALILFVLRSTTAPVAAASAAVAQSAAPQSAAPLPPPEPAAVPVPAPDPTPAESIAEAKSAPSAKKLPPPVVVHPAKPKEDDMARSRR